MVLKKRIQKSEGHTKNAMVYFTIYVEDMARAKQFYANVFNWDIISSDFEDFVEIRHKPSESIIGNFRSKKHDSYNKNPSGFECSIVVEDIDNTILTIMYNKGAIVTPKTEIKGIGWYIKFLDTEDNIVSAVQYSK